MNCNYHNDYYVWWFDNNNKYLIESENDDVLMLSIINVCIHKKQNKQIDSNDNKLSWKNMEQRMLRIKWKKKKLWLLWWW